MSRPSQFDARPGATRSDTAKCRSKVSSMGEAVDGRTSRHAHRRPELLELGADQLLVHGLSRVSMRPFAQSIGISHATLLHHFASKEDLLTELVGHLADQELGYWATQISEPDRRQFARRIWVHYSSTRGQRLFRLMFEAVGLRAYDEDFYGPLAMRMAAPWQMALEGLVAASSRPTGEATGLATLAIAQFRGLQLDLLATQDQARVDAAFELWLTRVLPLLDEREFPSA